MKRRDFLWTSVWAGGAWSLMGTHAGASGDAQGQAFGPWLRLSADGRVCAHSPVSDIGQGSRATLRLLVADELDIDPAQVDIETPPVEVRYRNPVLRRQATYGSAGFEGLRATVAPACAAARNMLLRAAAARLHQPVTALHTGQGAVLHTPGDSSLRTVRLAYAELLAEAAQLAPPEQPVPKTPPQWRLLGRPQPRPDLRQRVNGSFRYGIDERQRGQLQAVLLRGPGFDSVLEALDEAPARALPGVVAVLHLRGTGALAKATVAVAVVATRTWTAIKAARLLQPRWRQGAQGTLESDALRQQLLAAAARGEGLAVRRDEVFDRERTDAALAQAARRLDLSFDVPYLAHAAMEPMNATACVDAQGVSVWVSTQASEIVRDAVAALLQRPAQEVQVTERPSGGGFGRRLEPDVALQAVQIAAQLPGQAVQLIWSREQDLQGGWYRPASATRVQLGLGEDGLIQALRAEVAQPSLIEHSALRSGSPLQIDWTARMGWFRQAYAIPAMHLGWTRVDPGVPCGYWRSVGSSQNIFSLEQCVDAAAREVKRDPLAYRLQLCAARPEVVELLQELATRSQWHAPRQAGQGLGMALALESSSGAITATAVALRITAPGRFQLLGITVVSDVGVVGDPLAVEAQLMGGTVFGLSAALAGEITMREGRVDQSRFSDYPLVKLGQVPPLQVFVRQSSRPSAGVGEDGPPTIGPAIANALVDAGAERPLRLPLTRAGWQMELAA
jgi:isoquinoline 1-oxidoreductase beta subunit